MNKVIRKYNIFLMDEEEKKRLVFCLLSTFVLGLISHAYAYFSGDFSHDSLSAIFADESEENWKIALGRICFPVYRAIIRGGIAMPWVIGLLSLLWIGLSVYLIVKIFNLHSRVFIVLLSGILVTNITVTAMTATFLYELDVDMFALLTATMAVCLWKKYSWGFLAGTIFIAVTLGTYQSYISVAITLIMLASMWALLNGEDFSKVFIHGVRGIVMLIGGGLLYILLLTLSKKVTGIVLSDSYNGLAGLANLSPVLIVERLPQAYHCWIQAFLHPKVSYIGSFVDNANACLFGLTGVMILFALLDKKINIAAKGLFLVLLGLLPLGMNVTFLLTSEPVHDLMRYAFVFYYFFVLLLADWLSQKKNIIGVVSEVIKGVICLIIAIIVWDSILTSNAAYLKKDIEHQSTLAQMTRVVDRLENMPEYIPGESSVVFVSRSFQADTMPGFEEVAIISGLESSTAITYNTVDMYNSYFEYLLNEPINVDGDKWNAFQTDPRVAEMNAFPGSNSIQIIDGVFVVKMG